jgi:hypothetical protein
VLESGLTAGGLTWNHAEGVVLESGRHRRRRSPGTTPRASS